MPDFNQLITIAVYVLIALFLLVQLFLALRPGFVWGLLMPLMFGLFWIVVVLQPDFLPFQLGLNEDTVSAFNLIGLLGALFSLMIYALCRAGMHLKRKSREKKRLARAEKAQRQPASAATPPMGNDAEQGNPN